MFLLLVVVIVPLLTSAFPSEVDDNSCGIQSYMAKIKGGQLAELDEFPWMVLLMYETHDGQLHHGCGGALINGETVLTAAHCCTRTRLGKLKYVRLGEYNIETDVDCIQEVGGLDCADKPIDIEIGKIVIHPNYSTNSWNKHHDIAILKLKDSAKFSDFIQPICLPTAPSKFPPKRKQQPVFVSGWGRTDLYKIHGISNVLSPIKLKLAIPIVHAHHCQEVFNARRQQLHLGPGQICAGGEEDRDSCIGDSGNGLMHFDARIRRWVIIGIVSFGWKECGTPGVPGIYTNVVHYLNWIHQNL